MPSLETPTTTRGPVQPQTAVALTVAFISGLTSLGYQVLWTRLLASGTGNTTYVFTIILAENAVLLGWGLAVGALSAFVAIAPAAIERGARLPVGVRASVLLLAVLAAGLVSSVIATRAALRAPLISALKAE